MKKIFILFSLFFLFLTTAAATEKAAALKLLSQVKIGMSMKEFVGVMVECGLEPETPNDSILTQTRYFAVPLSVSFVAARRIVSQNFLCWSSEEGIYKPGVIKIFSAWEGPCSFPWYESEKSQLVAIAVAILSPRDSSDGLDLEDVISVRGTDPRKGRMYNVRWFSNVKIEPFSYRVYFKGVGEEKKYFLNQHYQKKYGLFDRYDYFFDFAH